MDRIMVIRPILTKLAFEERVMSASDDTVIPKSVKNLSGKTFGRLTVISFDGIRTKRDGKTIAFWNCQCECGSFVSVMSVKLIHGRKKSCGNHVVTHGQTLNKKPTKEYSTWLRMIARCENPNNEHDAERYKDAEERPGKPSLRRCSDFRLPLIKGR